MPDDGVIEEDCPETLDGQHAWREYLDQSGRWCPMCGTDRPAGAMTEKSSTSKPTCDCYLCRTHSFPGLEDYWPSGAVSDHSGSESEDSPASHDGLVGLLAIRVSLPPSFVTPTESATLYFNSEADALRFFAESEIKSPSPDGVKPPLRGEWDSFFSEEDGHLFLTLRLRHER